MHFTFGDAMFINFDALTQRIDVKAWLGPEGSRYASSLIGGSNQATIDWQIDNLNFDPFSVDTKLFAAQYPAPPTGAGIDIWEYVSGRVTAPGSSFQLRSLDVTFTIPTTWSLPTSPITNLSLWIGGAGDFRSVDVPAMPPLATVVPDPSATGILMLMAMAVSRLRADRKV